MVSFFFSKEEGRVGKQDQTSLIIVYVKSIQRRKRETEKVCFGRNVKRKSKCIGIKWMFVPYQSTQNVETRFVFHKRKMI